MADLHPTADAILPEFAPRADRYYINPNDPRPEMDNSGKQPIKVPGFNGVPVDFEENYQHHRRFAHGANDWKQYTRLTVRELSMLSLMNALTDKPNWSEKVFNDEIAEKWHQEALTKPFISEKAWQWCLAELRDKARAFEKTGYVPAYDTGSGIIKSDHLVSEELRQELIQAARPLQDMPADQKDWHPRSDDQVLNLVHPSLYPLVYGRTMVMAQGGEAGVENFLDSCGKGEVSPLQRLVFAEAEGNNRRIRFWGSHVPHNGSRYSEKFQWLPCEVAFQGEQGNNVKITSYINNLHPVQHKPLYGVIEKLISLSIEPWNKVLVYRAENRTPLRIRTHGYEFEPPLPEWFEEVRKDTYLITREKLGDEEFEKCLQRTREYLKLPDDPDFEESDLDDDPDAQEDQESYLDGTWEQKEDLNLQSVIEWKWQRMRKTKHPEPGVAFTYEEWKAGQVNKSVIPPLNGGAGVWGKHKQYDVDLGKTWRERGLQVIIKLASIELTPTKQKYEGGNWHIEGMLNEHIVATSIYYYDVENTTESRISFRQEADLDDMDMNYEQDQHQPLCDIFGTDSMRDEAAVQDLGSISTRQGRLLAFPNTLQHRVEPFRLQDPTRPGHRRFIVMWLVDPNYRIASTRNVPPQQHAWWAPAGYHKVPIEERLPAELANMITEEVGEWPMGMEEARKLRLELMDERTNLMPLVEANFDEYNFCEH